MPGRPAFGRRTGQTPRGCSHARTANARPSSADVVGSSRVGRTMGRLAASSDAGPAFLYRRVCRGFANLPSTQERPEVGCLASQ